MGAIDVSLELGKIAEVVNAILTRRADRQESMWLDFEDDIEAAATLIGRIDRLYVDLLEEIQWSAAGQGGGLEELAQLTKEIHQFIHDDSLAQLLADLHGRIEEASQSKHLRPRRQRKLAEVLCGLEQSIGAYRSHIDQVRSGATSVDSKERHLYNMASVLRLLETGEGEMQLRDLCEEAIRNRRLDLIHSTRWLAGRAIQEIRMRVL